MLLQWKIFHFYDCWFNITEFGWILKFWKFVKIWKCFLKHQVHTSSTLIFHQTVLLIKLIFSWGFSHQKGGRERMCRYVCVYLNVKEIGSKCVGDAHLASLSMITSENVFLKTFFFLFSKIRLSDITFSHLICKSILFRAITQNHFTNTLKTIV